MRSWVQIPSTNIRSQVCWYLCNGYARKWRQDDAETGRKSFQLVRSRFSEIKIGGE